MQVNMSVEIKNEYEEYEWSNWSWWRGGFLMDGSLHWTHRLKGHVSSWVIWGKMPLLSSSWNLICDALVLLTLLSTRTSEQKCRRWIKMHGSHCFPACGAFRGSKQTCGWIPIVESRYKSFLALRLLHSHQYTCVFWVGSRIQGTCVLIPNINMV